MSTRNDITGDALTTGAASNAYRAGHDAIDWSVKYRGVPLCHGDYLLGNTQAERDCGTCPHYVACRNATR